MILDLVRLLGHVHIGAELNTCREGDRGGFFFTVDQIDPVLISRRKRIHHTAAQRGIHGKVAEYQAICGEVALREIDTLSRLIVKTTVGLVVVRQEHAVFRIKRVIDSRIDAPVLIRRRQHCCRSCTEVLH